MHRIRARRPLFARIAALAILLASLLPTLSQALNLGRQVGWVEVCSAQGSRWVPTGAAAAEPGDGPVSSPLAHCPGCVSPNHAPSLPPPATPGHGLLGLDQAPPASPPSLAPTPQVWPAAHSRGPPLFS